MIIAIDSGPVRSAYVILDGRASLEHGWTENDALLAGAIAWMSATVGGKGVVERPRLYGKRAGSDIGDAIFWAGRFAELLGASMTLDEIRVALTTDRHGTKEDMSFAVARYFGKSTMADLTRRGGLCHKWTDHEKDALRLAVAYIKREDGK